MSANTYHQIDRDEFENVLASLGDYEAVDVANTKEIVYDIATEHEGLTVRVFSTLDVRGDDTARDAGADAIRTMVWSHSRDRPVAHATRTNRIQTWASNLAPKVEEMREKADEIAAADEDAERAASDALDGLHYATGDDREIAVTEIVETKFGPKAALESPYDAKDDIKALDWDQTHRAWDADRKAWVVDAESLGHVADELREAGWDVVRPDPDAEPEFDYLGALRSIDEADRISVTYETKTAGTEKEVEGEVVRSEDTRVTFTRTDDGHPMFLTRKGLFTARSHHPYVGFVTDIEVR